MSPSPISARLLIVALLWADSALTPAFAEPMKLTGLGVPVTIAGVRVTVVVNGDFDVATSDGRVGLHA